MYVKTHFHLVWNNMQWWKWQVTNLQDMWIWQPILREIFLRYFLHYFYLNLNQNAKNKLIFIFLRNPCLDLEQNDVAFAMSTSMTAAMINGHLRRGGSGVSLLLDELTQGQGSETWNKKTRKKKTIKHSRIWIHYLYEQIHKEMKFESQDQSVGVKSPW